MASFSMRSFAPERVSANTHIVLVLLPLFFFLLNLHGTPLFDVDEGAFSEATREMLKKADYLSTWLNGQPRFDKPILIYWCQLAFTWLLGPTEWAFRLPSALAASFWCYAVGLFVAQREGRGAGIFTCIVAAASLGVHAIGRAATADALLNMLITLTLIDAWRHLETKQKAPLLRSFLWMGLGTLTKGPIAILIPCAVTFLYCLVSKRLHHWVKASFNMKGWLIFLVIVIPWYAAALHIHGQAFINGFILKHNVQRFSGPLEGHSGSIFYYVLIVPVLLFPWLFWLFGLVKKFVYDMNEPINRFLWIWACFVIVFFSFSGTKLPHYALYGCTPLFILIGFHRDIVTKTWLATLPSVLLTVLFLALPSIVTYALSAGWVKDAYYVTQLGRIDKVVTPWYYVIVLCVLIASLLIAFMPRVEVWKKTATISLIQLFAITLAVTPLIGELLQGPVKRAGLFAYEKYPGESIVMWNFQAPSFSVYSQRETPARQPLSGQIALTRSDRLPSDAHVDVLFKEGAVLLVRVK